MLRSLATSGTELPAASFASASRSLRTICSGEYPLPIQSPPSAHLGRSDSHSSWTSFRGAGHYGARINLQTLAQGTARGIGLLIPSKVELRDCMKKPQARA